MKPYNLFLDVHYTWEILQYWHSCASEVSFPQRFPGKFLQAPMFWDLYLPPQETCLSVVSQREWYVFEIISIATSRNHSGLSFLTSNCPYTAFRISQFPNPFPIRLPQLKPTANRRRRLEKAGENC